MLRSFLSKAALVFLSIGATLVVLEFAVFRTILKPDDLLENVTINGVVRYKPNQRAVFRHPDGRTSTVTINGDGWNSTRDRYTTARHLHPARTRIAVVGDSYVHGAFIDTEEGFPHLLETRLNETQGRGLVEVYQFGMDGAPLSQYLHMLRREVVDYRPDIVVVPLIHNDFDESFRLLRRRTASSFMKVRQRKDGGFDEIAPKPFKAGLADALRRSALFRYVYYETNLYLRIKALVSKYYWGGDDAFQPAFISSAVDIRHLKDEGALRAHTRYVLEQMRDHAKEHGYKLFFVMDGVREATYAGKTAASFEVGKLNALARELTRSLDLPFLDLQKAFDDDFAMHKARLEFAYDWHWNERGNRIVAEEIAQSLLRRPDWFRPEERAPIPGNTAELKPMAADPAN